MNLSRSCRKSKRNRSLIWGRVTASWTSKSKANLKSQPRTWTNFWCQISLSPLKRRRLTRSWSSSRNLLRKSQHSSNSWRNSKSLLLKERRNVSYLFDRKVNWKTRSTTSPIGWRKWRQGTARTRNSCWTRLQRTKSCRLNYKGQVVRSLGQVQQECRKAWSKEIREITRWSCFRIKTLMSLNPSNSLKLNMNEMNTNGGQRNSF